LIDLKSQKYQKRIDQIINRTPFLGKFIAEKCFGFGICVGKCVEDAIILEKK
jgi:Pyruvate/2-oxoacid:ferredoxin oxidoreductase delta subunit